MRSRCHRRRLCLYRLRRHAVYGLAVGKGPGAKAVEGIVVMGKGGSLSSVEGASADGKYIWVDFEKVDASNVSNYQ